MAPTKPKSGSSKGTNKRSTKPDSSKSSSKVRKSGKPVATTQQKKHTTSRKNDAPKQKKKRVYTEKELRIPSLNMITPAGVQKPKGKKKGKIFVDDQESMMTILAMVNADKEGQIESKMMKAVCLGDVLRAAAQKLMLQKRQMEEIRQARQREMDARQEDRKAKLEDTKNSMRRSKSKRKTERPDPTTGPTGSNSHSLGSSTPSLPKKRVSFG